MPVYGYIRNDNGNYHEEFMSVAEMEKRQNKKGEIVLDDGATATRTMGGEQRAGSACKIGAPWSSPLESEAAGIHPAQRAEELETCRRHGINDVDFDRKTGTALFKSRSGRKKYLKLHGLVDKSGGYSD